MTARQRRLGAEPEIAAAHELGLAAFLRPARRGRFRQLLRCDRGRAKIRASLAHFRDLDPAAREPIPADQQTRAGIEALLASAGAPDMCYVVSEDATLDGTELPLRAALDALVGGGRGALLSCLPGRLAYFEGEEPHDRCILRHDDV